MIKNLLLTTALVATTTAAHADTLGITDLSQELQDQIAEQHNELAATVAELQIALAAAEAKNAALSEANSELEAELDVVNSAITVDEFREIIMEVSAKYDVPHQLQYHISPEAVEGTIVFLANQAWHAGAAAGEEHGISVGESTGYPKGYQAGYQQAYDTYIEDHGSYLEDKYNEGYAAGLATADDAIAKAKADAQDEIDFVRANHHYNISVAMAAALADAGLKQTFTLGGLDQQYEWDAVIDLISEAVYTEAKAEVAGDIEGLEKQIVGLEKEISVNADILDTATEAAYDEGYDAAYAKYSKNADAAYANGYSKGHEIGFAAASKELTLQHEADAKAALEDADKAYDNGYTKGVSDAGEVIRDNLQNVTGNNAPTETLEQIDAFTSWTADYMAAYHKSHGDLGYLAGKYGVAGWIVGQVKGHVAPFK